MGYEEAFSSRNNQKNNFLSPQRELNPWPSRYRLRLRFFIIYTLSKSPKSIHLSFICIYHFDTLSLPEWQDTCHTCKNLVYELAHHESPIAQWLERPTGTWKVMGSTPVGGSENFFSGYSTWKHFFKIFVVSFNADACVAPGPRFSTKSESTLRNSGQSFVYSGAHPQHGRLFLRKMIFKRRN